MKHFSRNGSPVILAVEMGYGHLRPAYALAELFNTKVIRIDVPPFADSVENFIWKAARTVYYGLSRACDWPALGPAAQRILANITDIDPPEKLSGRQRANLGAYLADGLTGTLIGQRFRDRTAWSRQTVIATYPVAAMAAGLVPHLRVFCLVTDTDLNRAWVPVKVEESRIHYLAPVERVAERLRSFGVPDHQIP